MMTGEAIWWNQGDTNDYSIDIWNMEENLEMFECTFEITASLMIFSNLAESTVNRFHENAKRLLKDERRNVMG